MRNNAGTPGLGPGRRIQRRDPTIPQTENPATPADGKLLWSLNPATLQAAAKYSHHRSQNQAAVVGNLVGTPDQVVMASNHPTSTTQNRATVDRVENRQGDGIRLSGRFQ